MLALHRRGSAPYVSSAATRCSLIEAWQEALHQSSSHSPIDEDTHNCCIHSPGPVLSILERSSDSEVAESPGGAPAAHRRCSGDSASMAHHSVQFGVEAAEAELDPIGDPRPWVTRCRSAVAPLRSRISPSCVPCRSSDLEGRANRVRAWIDGRPRMNPRRRMDGKRCCTSASLTRIASVLALMAGFGALAAGALEASSGAPSGAASPGEPPLRVVASIFPLADVAAQVGGDAAEVVALLPPGLTPHDFDPKPPDVERVARADLLLVVGLSGDLWANRVASASANDDLRILSLSEMVPAEALIPQDPHAWLDPVLMAHFTGALADSMAAMRPAVASELGNRATELQSQLAQLDQAYRERLAPYAGGTIASLHTAFGYIAARYDLREVGLYHAHMEEGGAHGFEHLVAEIRAHDLRTLFVQPQLPPGRTRWIQEETGVHIEVLDPIGNPQREGYDSYLGLMRRNLDALERGLQP
ncbi:MAG: hypothetical protein GF330_00635 [Candidatus Eisenbacteria bacterium]|nr:hypothetical protein [Candidatus Eisenbacteria bacterium]